MALIAFSTVRLKKIELSPNHVLGRVLDMFFDPKNLVCTAVEIRPFYRLRSILISANNLTVTSRSKQLRIQEPFKKVDKVDSQKVVSTSVYTEKGDYLGKVKDFLFESETFTLVQLDVSKNFFFWKKQGYLIHRNEIINVEKDKITVRDELIYEDASTGITLPGIDIPIMQNKSLNKS